MWLRLGMLMALASLVACASSPGGQAPARDAETRCPDTTAAPTLEAWPDQPVPEPLVDLVGSQAKRDEAPSDVIAVAPDPEPATFASSWDFYRRRYDADEDERVTRAEYTRTEAAFGRLDADGDGILTEGDFARRWDRVPRVPPGQKTFSWGEGGPRFGDPAPDFRLATTSGEEIDLGRFRGHKPVVLVFGSFT